MLKSATETRKRIHIEQIPVNATDEKSSPEMKENIGFSEIVYHVKDVTLGDVVFCVGI